MIPTGLEDTYPQHPTGYTCIVCGGVAVMDAEGIYLGAPDAVRSMGVEMESESDVTVGRGTVREALQGAPPGVEDIRMSLSHQRGGYGHTPQPAAPRTAAPIPVSTRTIMCATCGGPLDGHDMFGECFPAACLGESPPLVVRNGRLVAV